MKLSEHSNVCYFKFLCLSSDVEKLKKLLLHNPITLTLSEEGHSKDDIIPKNVQFFLISCSAHDKLLYMLSLLKLELVQKKVIIFVYSIDMAFRLRLFLEKDVARGVTSHDVQEARCQDLKNEMLNSEKLKAHFEENPRDLDLLKHDKLLSKKVPPTHLCEIPEYLLDPTTQEASKIVKLSRAAMGLNTARKSHTGLKRGFGRSSDTLKTFSAEGTKSRSGEKRRDNNGKID